MEIEIRKANESDTQFLFDLRNKDYVYKNSGTPKPVEWQEHINWLEKVFSGKANKELFIIEFEGDRAGQVRFDIGQENKQAIVNISLLKEFHGKGIAKEAIEQGMDKMAKEKEIEKFIGEIHQDNIASQKLFEKLGFEFQSQNDVWITYLKKSMLKQLKTTLIIAEISANHNGDFEKAKELVKQACLAGADVIKIQTYTPDTMTLNSEKDLFQVNVNEAWKGQTLHHLYQIAQTPWEWHSELEKIAKENNCLFIGTPYDITSVDFLESKNCPFYKVASFEATDINLLKKIAQTKKSVVIARGMTSFAELFQAIEILKESGADDIAILHCVSAYPTKVEDLNLLTIPEIQKKFPDVVVGLSDHSLSVVSGSVGVALGAKIIERHFILNRKDGGPDAAFSLEPQEFSKMVEMIRETEKMLGKPFLETVESERENKQFRRSLWVIKDMKKGEVFTKENIGSFRPSCGLEPKYLEEILGKKANKDIEFGTPLTKDLF